VAGRAAGGRAARDVVSALFVRTALRIVAVAWLGDVHASESLKTRPGSMSESSPLESYEIFREFESVPSLLTAAPSRVLPLQFPPILAVLGFFRQSDERPWPEVQVFGKLTRPRTLIFNVRVCHRRRKKEPLSKLSDLRYVFSPLLFSMFACATDEEKRNLLVNLVI